GQALRRRPIAMKAAAPRNQFGYSWRRGETDIGGERPATAHPSSLPKDVYSTKRRQFGPSSESHGTSACPFRLTAAESVYHLQAQHVPIREVPSQLPCTRPSPDYLPKVRRRHKHYPARSRPVENRSVPLPWPSRHPRQKSCSLGLNRWRGPS